MRMIRTEEPHISRRADTPLPRGVATCDIPKLLFLRAVEIVPSAAQPSVESAGGTEDLPRWTAEGCAPAATSTTWPLCGTSFDCYWCRFEKQSHHTSLSRLMSSLPSTSGLSVRSTNAGVSCENVTGDFFRCILSCFGAPRRTQEMFGRRSAFPFWIRSKRCAHVSYGFWSERCNTHVVSYRSFSCKGCASNVDGRPLVRPCSRSNQHIFRRPTPTLAWHTNAARQAASSPITLLDSSWTQGSVWSSHQIFQAIRSLSGSQLKLRMRSRRCCF